MTAEAVHRIVQREDQVHRTHCLNSIPTEFRYRANQIASNMDRVPGNRFLLELKEAAQVGTEPLIYTDDEIQKAAKHCSHDLTLRMAMFHDDIDLCVNMARMYLKRWGIKVSPSALVKMGKLPFLNRANCELWWRGQLRKTHARKAEQIGINLGLVHKHTGGYCSQFALDRRRDQKARNRALLGKLEAENDEGQTYGLNDLASLSISNPWIRRSELMVRMRGFENYATDYDHVAEFYTITCPSRFHSHLSASGQRNPNYDNSTPRQGQKYLCNVWARIRAKLHRDGINVYGFRIAEPHHDGCPHWHLLLFMKSEYTTTVREIMRHHALAESGDEKGAQEHRFQFVSINPDKGSATGYIAKYVSKNIDGYAVAEDFETNGDAATSSERVEAWASTWGIRQFQQIGGPPVGVWREFRRMDHEEEGLVEEARAAADASDWSAYCRAQGGATVRRKDMPIKVAVWEEYDPQTGALEQPSIGRYGDTIAGRIFGIVCRGVYYATRFYKWTVSWLPESKRDQPTLGRAKSGFNLMKRNGGCIEKMSVASAAHLEFCQ